MQIEDINTATRHSLTATGKDACRGEPSGISIIGFVGRIVEFAIFKPLCKLSGTPTLIKSSIDAGVVYCRLNSRPYPHPKLI